MTNTVPNSRTSTTHKLVVTAMLSAVAFALMFIEVPIPALIPSFVKMDISDLPELLGAFALGPVYGGVVCLLKNLLHIVIKGTSTGGVGELCNFLLGVFFVAPAGAIYQALKPKASEQLSREENKKKGLKAAIIGSLVGAVVMAVASVPLNYFITYPVYAALFGGMEPIIGAYQAILPSMRSLIQCLVVFNMPFTFVKGLLDVILCLLIYKPLSPLLHK
jgi:riboflavin transporter FmnP